MIQERRAIGVPVIRAARFVLAHVPDLVMSGSKPRRELARQGEVLRTQLRAHLRSFRDAVAYPPHQVLIGNQVPELLYEFPRPWHMRPMDNAPAVGAAGMIIDQDTFYAWLARADTANLIVLDDAYVPRIAAGLDGVRGGTLAKAIGELAGVRTPGGADVKAFGAGPVHALILAGALIAAGVHRRVVVVGGGSLAKLGMKFRGHLTVGYPILEDVLAGMAIDVVADDGRSPELRLDAAMVHRIDDGGAGHHIYGALAPAPPRQAGLRLSDVDRFAVELHNPDITEPAGSGDVPGTNYTMLAALAARAGEITREQMPAFVRAHGLPGFSPTQGHIPSAIPYLPHAIRGLTEGTMKRVQFIAKGSLFLGRMTGMSDGASILLERNTQLAGKGVTS